MIQVTPRIALDERELVCDFVRASGPGGQNVNKVATAAQLRFDAKNSPSLDDETRHRLMKLAGRRLNTEGVIVIIAQRYRTQERNRADAIERLLALIRTAAEREKPRRPTQPSLGARRRRLDSKAKHSAIKRLRGSPLD